jgi:putative protease
LAPAGDDDALSAALQAGADAVYFGLDEGLNARARARNFALANLAATTERIHRAGALAYVTLNTLVFQEELGFLEEVLRQLAQAGVDALIVQDPAVALLARQVAPTLHVHASTQMTVSSPEAAAFAATLGVQRIVVPRELSVSEIRLYAAGTTLELEVFVHGALCMSWSGQCLTSEAWGGRSANRGQCAQSCRMPYVLEVDGQSQPTADVQYLLSPRDLAGIRSVPALAEIGVASLKIEGRQKSAQYVWTATRSYREQLDSLAHAGRVPASRLATSLQHMALSYSRGFTDGFLGGVNHQNMVEGRFPKHRGVLLGEVVAVEPRAVRVRPASRVPTGAVAAAAVTTPGEYKIRPADGELAAQAHELAAAPELAQTLDITAPQPQPGMGVVFDQGQPERKDEPGGPLFRVDRSGQDWLLGFGQPGPDLRRVQPGDKVWLTSDPELTRAAERLVAAEPPAGRIAVRVVVTGSAGLPLNLKVTALGSVGRDTRLTLQTDTPLQPAAGQGLDAALLTDKVASAGGTPFRLAELDCTGLAPGLHLAVSQLKALRRQWTAALWQAVQAAHVHQTTTEPAALAVVTAARQRFASRQAEHKPLPTDIQLLPLCRTEAQLDAVIAAGLPEVELDWMELVGLTRAVDKAKAAGLRVTIATVRVQKPGEDGFDKRIARLQPDGVLVRHWGGLMHFAGLPVAQRPAVHGDFSLNVTNSVTAHHLLALGCDTLTAAHDLDETQLHALLDHVPAERLTVVVHHHIATFHTEHCVYAHLLSHGRDFRSCGRPCEQHRVALRDHVGHAHPVVVDVGCRNTVFNAEAQSAASAVPRLLERGVRRFRLEFVWETAEQTASVLGGWQALLAGTLTPRALVAQIASHEQFGVTAGTMRTLAQATQPAQLEPMAAAVTP